MTHHLTTNTDAGDLSTKNGLDATASIDTLSQGGGRGLWLIIAVSLAVHVVCLVAGQTVLSDWRWPHHPVHAAVEMAGGLIAFWVAWMLMLLEKRGLGTSFNVWIAGALIGMGTLDGVHALVHAGHEFVWLHSTATFAGGLLFTAVWFPREWQGYVRDWWPWTVAAAVVAFSIFSLVMPDYTPRMLVVNESGEKVFTTWARALNVVGGVLLFAAAIRLLLTWRATRNEDDLLFFLHCTLFGAAAVMFEQSQLWDLPWWGWHGLRLTAYAVALWFVVLSDLRATRELSRRAVVLNRLSAVVDSTDDAIIGLAVDGSIVSWNRGAERLTGQSESVVIGQPVSEFVPEDFRKALSEFDRRSGHHNQADPIESVWQHTDGTEVNVSVAVSPIRDEAGRQAGYSWVARDISHRRRSEQELRRKETLIRSLLEATAEGIYGLDLDGNCTWANPACAELLGYDSPSEFLGINMHNLIHHTRPDGTSYPNHECRIYKAFREGRTVDF